MEERCKGSEKMADGPRQTQHAGRRLFIGSGCPLVESAITLDRNSESFHYVAFRDTPLIHYLLENLFLTVR